MNKIHILNLLLIVAVITIGLFVPPFLWVSIALVGIFFFLIIGVHVFAYGDIYCKGLRLKRLLKHKKRIMPLDDAKSKIAQGQGTIIIEAPTAGWNVNRIWWCQDSIAKWNEEDREKNQLCTPETIANYDRYISEDTGSTKLVDIFVFTQKTKKYLTEHFGHNDYCFIPSALVYVQRKIDNEKSNADSETKTN